MIEAELDKLIEEQLKNGKGVAECLEAILKVALDDSAVEWENAEEHKAKADELMNFLSNLAKNTSNYVKYVHDMLEKYPRYAQFVDVMCSFTITGMEAIGDRKPEISLCHMSKKAMLNWLKQVKEEL